MSEELCFSFVILSALGLAMVGLLYAIKLISDCQVYLMEQRMKDKKDE